MKRFDLLPRRRIKKVVFLHGLKSHPGGTKATWLGEHFDAVVPALDTTSLEAARVDALDALDGDGADADLLIGSSFGGALALRLVAEGHWTRPVVLLAPAVQYAPEVAFDPTTRVAVVLGRRDDVVDWTAVVKRFADAGPEVQLFLGGWGHRLMGALEDGTIRRAIHWALDLNVLPRPERARVRERRRAEEARGPEPAAVTRFVAAVRGLLAEAPEGPLRTLALAIDEGRGLSDEACIEGATIPHFHQLFGALGWRFASSHVQPREGWMYDRIRASPNDDSDLWVQLHALFPSARAAEGEDA